MDKKMNNNNECELPKTKQVIVWRNDLKVRKGKYGAQVAHASSAWLVNRIKDSIKDNGDPCFDEYELLWMNTTQTKICLQVENEAELLEIYNKAKKANLTVELITDLGLTEFGGVPTITCLAIGPEKEDKIDAITKSLKLM